VNKKLGAILAVLAYTAALALFAVLWWPTIKAASISEEERRLNLDSFDQVWTTVAENHFDPALQGVDWQAARDELRPRMERARTQDQDRKVMKELLSRLGQSHYVIVPSQAYAQMEEATETAVQYGTPGIDVRIIDGQPVVTQVEEGSPAAAAGVKAGWQIVRIRGQKTDQMIATAERELAGRSWQQAGMAEAIYRRLSGPLGSEIAIDFLDEINERAWRRISVARPRGQSFKIGNAPPIDVSLSARHLDESLGYISFSVFAHPTYVMQEFNKAMSSFSEAPGVVIDLRGNSGGMLEMVTGMMGWFVDETRHVGTQYFRDHELKLLVRPRHQIYRGPVAVLVDELCGSGAELFASGLQDLGRAVIVGSPTSGSVLGSNFERLPNGDGLQYAISNYISATTGEPLEGIGVQPDIKVSPTRAALLAGRDPVLDAAVEWIRQQPANWRFDQGMSPQLAQPKLPSFDKGEKEFDSQAVAVLDGHVTAIGGTEAYAQLHNRLTRATVEITDQSIEISFLQYRARPNKSYSVFESEELGKIESGTNGGVAWSIDLMKGPQLKTGSERDFELRAAWFDGEVRWRQGFQTVAHAGTVDVEGRRCHRIELGTAVGAPETRYYDVESGLLRRSEVILELPEGTITLETSHSDYRRVDGLLLAHQVRMTVMGQERVVTFESIEHNIQLPEGIFDVPAEIQ